MTKRPGDQAPAECSDRERQDFMRLINEAERQLLSEIDVTFNFLGWKVADALDRAVSRPRSLWERICDVFNPNRDKARREWSELDRLSKISGTREAMHERRDHLENRIKYAMGAVRAGHPNNPKYRQVKASGAVLTLDGWLVNEKRTAPAQVRATLAGITEGQICCRDGCDGVIEIKPAEDCSCHLSAPCSWCVSRAPWCPACGWEAE